MAKVQSEFAEMAAQLGAEIQATAEAVARELPFAQPGSDVAKLSKADLLAHVQRNWGDPAFRMALLDRLAPAGMDGQRPRKGVEGFLALASDAFPFGYEPPPPAPMVAAGLPVDPAMMTPAPL